MKTQRESMPWLRKREGQVWTADDTAHVERTVAEVEATWKQLMEQARKALEDLAA